METQTDPTQGLTMEQKEKRQKFIRGSELFIEYIDIIRTKLIYSTDCQKYLKPKMGPKFMAITSGVWTKIKNELEKKGKDKRDIDDIHFFYMEKRKIFNAKLRCIINEPHIFAHKREFIDEENLRKCQTMLKDHFKLERSTAIASIIIPDCKKTIPLMFNYMFDGFLDKKQPKLPNFVKKDCGESVVSFIPAASNNGNKNKTSEEEITKKRSASTEQDVIKLPAPTPSCSSSSSSSSSSSTEQKKPELPVRTATSVSRTTQNKVEPPLKKAKVPKPAISPSSPSSSSGSEKIAFDQTMEQLDVKSNNDNNEAREYYKGRIEELLIKYRAALALIPRYKTKTAEYQYCREEQIFFFIAKINILSSFKTDIVDTMEIDVVKQNYRDILASIHEKIKFDGDNLSKLIGDDETKKQKLKNIMDDIYSFSYGYTFI